jgi:ferritin-like metal-binding protein YciE
VKVKTFNDLFVEQLKDVYSAEKQLLQALPKMAKAASSMEVQRAFEKHLEMTERQKGRLDQIFERIGATPGRMKCKGMEGLIAEGEELIKSGEKSQVMDAGLIASAQKVEHYEMATYGTLRTFANMLGEKEVANLLQQTLNEEGETDHMLTRLA